MRSATFANLTCRAPTLAHPIPSPGDGALLLLLLSLLLLPTIMFMLFFLFLLSSLLLLLGSVLIDTSMFVFYNTFAAGYPADEYNIL